MRATSDNRNNGPGEMRAGARSASFDTDKLRERVERARERDIALDLTGPRGRAHSRETPARARAARLKSDYKVDASAGADESGKSTYARDARNELRSARAKRAKCIRRRRARRSG